MKVDTKTKKFIDTKRFWAGILFAQFLLFYILSKSDIILILHNYLFEAQKKIHQLLFSIIPFSIGDIAYLFLFLIIVYWVIKRIKQKEYPITRKLLILTNILYFIYQLLWGLLYFQTSIHENLKGIEYSENDTKKIISQILNICKEERELISSKDFDNIESINKDIISGQNNIPKEFTHLHNPTSVISIKASLYSQIMNYTGILGYYNPFTAESQINYNIPKTEIPFTIAHETSHQFGFAREDEASFIGYLNASSSKSVAIKYSAHFYALKSLLRTFRLHDSIYVKNCVTRFTPKMKNDLLQEKEYIKKYQGKLDDIFYYANDLFLKSNRQKGAVSYNNFQNLLIRYEIKKRLHLTMQSQKHK